MFPYFSVKLCKLKYFNDHCFYRFQKGFLIECGDAYLPAGVGPASYVPAAAPAAASSGAAPARVTSNRGGDSVWHVVDPAHGPRFFPHEPTAALSHRSRGTVTLLPVPGSTALHGSLFAITLSDDLTYLDPTCAPIGRVVEGLDEFVAKLANILTEPVSHQPKQNIRIRHALVLEDPFPDPPGWPSEEPSSPRALLHPFDVEVLEEEDRLEQERTKDLTDEQRRAAEQAAEAHSRAVVLEMLGDLPDADAEPPPNVLFVCKLHPVTRSDDLELIFSRFGNLLSCEVIKDPQTGASLQYAFVEFEDAQAAERAYFKMNNVLIDQRRIKVDFSQSVAKQWKQIKDKKAAKNAPPPQMRPTQAAAPQPRTAVPLPQPAAPHSAPAAAAVPAVTAAPAAAPPSSSHPSSSRRSRSRSRSPRHRSIGSSRRPRSPVSERSSRSSPSRDRSRERRSYSHHRSRDERRSRSRDRQRTRSRSRDHAQRSSRHREDDRHTHHSSSSRRRSRSRSRSRSPRKESKRDRRSRSRSPSRSPRSSSSRHR
jgi:peptidyl-prolyl cis-trans isomerase-like 4